MEVAEELNGRRHPFDKNQTVIATTSDGLTEAGYREVMFSGAQAASGTSALPQTFRPRVGSMHPARLQTLFVRPRVLYTSVTQVPKNQGCVRPDEFLKVPNTKINIANLVTPRTAHRE